MNNNGISKEELRALKERLSSIEDLMLHADISKESLGSFSSSRNPPPSAVANPSPLGLLGFAIVSFLSGVLKIFPDSTARLDGLFAGTAIFVGGVTQLIAGLVQIAKNETHSATVFCLFGLHWISNGCLLAVSSLQQVSFAELSKASVATYFCLLTVSTIILWIPTFRMNYVLSTTLGTVSVVFLLDAIAATESRGVEIAAGAASCLAASLAFYLALLDVVNETWKRPILPLFPHVDHKSDYDITDRPYVPRRTFHKSSMSSAHI